MLINELSKRTGIIAHTIRFYEKSGLIRDAKSVGFTIHEISQLIDAWYNNKMTVTEKLSILDEKLLSIEQRIKQLKEIKKLISHFKKDVLTDNC